MNYIGSKLTLLPFLEEKILEVTGGNYKVFCDIFAGTGAVGRHFKNLGFKVIANDLQYYAYALNKAYLEINHTPRFDRLKKEFKAEITSHRVSAKSSIEAVLSFVNALPNVAGFITNNYSPVGNRFYYTEKNASKADSIRQAVNIWKDSELITESEYFYLLCSLLEAIDQVANTASVYGAYLKQFKPSSLKTLRLKPLELTNHVSGCRVWNQDANVLIEKIECDVLYLDPPYNHRQYGANYHVLETIAAYDSPHIKGMTGMRDYLKSEYCRKSAAYDALEYLIRNARAKHIFVSYNDEGLLSLVNIQDILNMRGKPKKFIKKYPRYKADNNREYSKESTFEYLHYVKVIN